MSLLTLFFPLVNLVNRFSTFVDLKKKTKPCSIAYWFFSISFLFSIWFLFYLIFIISFLLLALGKYFLKVESQVVNLISQLIRFFVFFQQFKYTTPLPFVLQCFSWKNCWWSSIGSLHMSSCFFLAAFKIAFDFWGFGCTVSQFGSLWIYPTWSKLRFLHLYIHYSTQIGMFQPLFLLSLILLDLP